MESEFKVALSRRGEIAIVEVQLNKRSSSEEQADTFREVARLIETDSMKYSFSEKDDVIKVDCNIAIDKVKALLEMLKNAIL